MGEVGVALLHAAKRGPGTVVQLAERACVGYGAARYTASRLVSAGALVPLSAGRPAVLGAAPTPTTMQQHEEDITPPPVGGLRALPSSFWQVVTAEMARRRIEEDDAMT